MCTAGVAIQGTLGMGWGRGWGVAGAQERGKGEAGRVLTGWGGVG